MIWRNRFHLFGLLFIAVAIQAITPDSHDVASLRGLYVLCGIPLPVEAFGDEFSEQEAPACIPFGHHGLIDLGKVIDRTSRSGTGSSSPRMSLRNARATLFVVQERFVQFRPLCFALCRLVC
jgi:hypothetical protein